MGIRSTVHTAVSRKGAQMTMYLDVDAEAIRKVALSLEATPPPDSDFLFVLYAVLMRVKGIEVTLSDVHDAWAAWMSQTTPAHRALVPFDDLGPNVQDEDVPYLEAIRAVAKSRKGS